jgi:hypothetical protein
MKKFILLSQNASPSLVIFRKDFIEYLVSPGHKVYAFAIDYKSESRSIFEAMGAIPV